MKKVLISIIIILTILLIGQGIYYSLDIKEENINESRENSISNTMRIFNDVNTVEKIENVIVPDGMDEFIKKYSGSQKIIPLEKNFYEFIYTTVPNIYGTTIKLSNNKIAQLYDLNKEKINNMNIYSSDDFYNITNQIRLVGNKATLSKSVIDMTTYKADDNNVSVNVKFTYSNNTEITIKVYYAVKENVTPAISFAKPK